MTVTLSEPGAVCALGHNCETLWRAALAGDQAGLKASAFVTNDGTSLFAGSVADSVLPVIDSLPEAMRTRNNQLAVAALKQIEQPLQALIQKVGSDRVAVVLGTSTSGIASGEEALAHDETEGGLPGSFYYSMQEMLAPAECIATLMGITGPVYSISTACSSSARTFMSARSLLRLGVVDAVVVGGVDSLCQLTLNGFKALESTSAGRCNPFSANRDGITIGEAAGLFIATRAEDKLQSSAVTLTGACATSDAHHMSAPHPQGRGALGAMQGALADAGVTAEQLSYINLHGTATPLNDQMEAYAVNELGAAKVPASSTKALTGHTLGAAGAIEAVFCWLALAKQNGLPKHVWDGVKDSEMVDINLYEGGLAHAIEHCLSNSFAFGGNNVSLVFSRRNPHGA
ncbi:beta-ketoacyl-ACP synthase [Idiomarina sp. HP20-50]|uniref:beta-ketoacyl-ACP synthase n=1 Tax=Idiomarina sp. HP20-50 TaxID=3070813 RepID=UPI00294B21A1|nr:beta-ketoacyl-ACP synthase [Idiomarina sp. HP20-50]MDV6316391.1 beta-ketoacyl-ACP synthase [Idiomarina sp. HP20-50]